MISGAMETADQIASKSPIAIQGTKVNLIYSRDHSVQESLHYIVSRNLYTVYLSLSLTHTHIHRSSSDLKEP